MMIRHFIKLELRKINIRPYFYAGIIIIACMIGFLYTFAMIAYVGGDQDAVEFSSYHNIWVLTNALQMVAYSVLTAVMFSTFLLRDYTGKNAILLFSYPIERKKIVQTKVFLVMSFVTLFMISGTVLIYAVFILTEQVFSLVPDELSIGLGINVLFDTLLCLFLSLAIGIISVRIGFEKKSVQRTIVAGIILCSCAANMIATMTYSYFPTIVMFLVAIFIAFISYKEIVNKIEKAEV